MQKMQMMMSQMMEIIKVSQGKDKETIVPETDSVGNGNRFKTNPIEIANSHSELRGILPFPKGKEKINSSGSQ